MAASNYSVLFATNMNSQKIVYLPTASSVPGRILYIKDFCGNSVPSSIYISTAAGDTIDKKTNTLYAKLSTSASLVKLASNGATNWMVLSHYTTALGQPPFVPPEPPPPPPAPWTSVTDGADASVVDNGGGSFTCYGPNDSGGNGWAYIYKLFPSAGSFNYNYNWFTSDGIFYDWPFIDITAANPAIPANVNFGNKIASGNSESGTRTAAYSANDYVVLGVYSSDSCCGRGECTFSALPT